MARTRSGRRSTPACAPRRAAAPRTAWPRPPSWCCWTTTRTSAATSPTRSSSRSFATAAPALRSEFLRRRPRLLLLTRALHRRPRMLIPTVGLHRRPRKLLPTRAFRRQLGVVQRLPVPTGGLRRRLRLLLPTNACRMQLRVARRPWSSGRRLSGGCSGSGTRTPMAFSRRTSWWCSHGRPASRVLMRSGPRNILRCARRTRSIPRAASPSRLSWPSWTTTPRTAHSATSRTRTSKRSWQRPVVTTS
mmetsp:Transcript_124575/g.398845  ORF Transcript_124575/g.398845 Transcript_124575/m.398845 type:complete len:247 (+) Transcript_124575:348-1088(+)